MKTLVDLLKTQFPNVKFDAGNNTLGVNAFAEWDSIGHLNYLLLVEEEYNIQFSDDEMAEMKTLQEVSEVLSAKGIAGVF